MHNISPFHSSNFISPTSVMMARDWFTRCERTLSDCVSYLAGLASQGVSYVTLDHIASAVFIDYALPSTPRHQRIPVTCWLHQCEEYLPAAYVRAYRVQLASLWAQGATVAQAVIYARVHLLAPESL